MDRSAAVPVAGGDRPGLGPGFEMPIIHDSDRYALVRDIGSGNFGVARLMRDMATGDLVAIKYIERGDKVINSGSVFHIYFLRWAIHTHFPIGCD
ncbi:hypothetical protein Dimus_036702 [Dionaea muscipula]